MNGPKTYTWFRSIRVELLLPDSLLSAFLSFLSFYEDMASWVHFSALKILQKLQSWCITQGSDPCHDSVHNVSAGRILP